MTYKDLITELKEQGYSDIREIGDRGLCGLFRFVFTTGLVYGLDDWGYNGRFCFENMADAKEALDNWDGINDPSGDWIKHKGKKGEYSNPNKINY